MEFDNLLKRMIGPAFECLTNIYSITKPFVIFASFAVNKILNYIGTYHAN